MGNCCLDANNNYCICGKNNSQKQITAKNVTKGVPSINSKKKISKQNSLDKNCSVHHVTAEEVDNAINKWVETTKRNHKKSLSISQTSSKLPYKNFDYSYHESEISKDFGQDNEMLRSFSEMTSSIQLTNLTKDVYMSKMRGQNINSQNNFQSTTLFNVLEELEEKFPLSNIILEKPTNTANPVKIFVNKDSNKTHANSIREIKLPSKNGTNSTGSKLGQIVSNVGVIVNKSESEVAERNNDTNNKDHFQDNALIYSRGIIISSEDEEGCDEEEEKEESFNVENVFYNIEKNSFDNIQSQQENSNNAISYTNVMYFNGIELNHYNSVSKDIKKSLVNYPQVTINNIIAQWNILQNNQQLAKINNCQLDTITVMQNKVNNSPILAAIVAILSNEITFNNNIFSNIVTENANDKNFVNIKLFINGRANIAVINKELPYISDNECIFAECSPSQIAMRVNLIEKLYYIMNSYHKNFNSNFSIEVYHLIGWLPEFYSLSQTINKEFFWNNFIHNFTHGDLMVCFANHSNGAESSLLKANETLPSSSDNVYYDIFYPVIFAKTNKIINIKLIYGKIIPKKANKITNDIFEISFDYAFEIFTHIYLCWNPDVYKKSYSLNSEYDSIPSSSVDKISKAKDEDYSLEENPQFIISIPPHKDDIEVKLLLMKHISSFNNNDEIAYKIFKYEGYPIIYLNGELRNFRKNGREIISDIICFGKSNTFDEYVIVVIKCDNKTKASKEQNVKFTLQLFCEIDIKIVEIPKRKKYISKRINDIWSIKLQNESIYNSILQFPQFKLSLSGEENALNHIQIILETKALSNIMLCLIESNGENLFHVSPEKFLHRKTPRIFSSSFSYLEIKIPNGSYLILCLSSTEGSSRRQSELKNFSLEVNSFSPFTRAINLTRLSPFPKYNNIERLEGEWTKKNIKSKGKQNIFLMFKNPCYEFTITKQGTRCYFYLKEINANKYIDFSNSPHIYLSIFKNYPLNSNNFSLIYDGTELPSSFWGFLIEDIVLEPGRYVLLCLNHILYKNLQFDVTIHSSNPISYLKPFYLITPRKISYNILTTWNGTLVSTTKYEMKSPIDNICDIELIVKKAENSSVGLIVMENNDNDNVVINAQNLPNVKEDIFIASDIKMKGMANYVLIPFSYEKKKFQIDINVNSNEEINIKKKTVNVSII